MDAVTIGVLYIEYIIPGARSLKDKRRVLNSLKTRMRNRFNCSVAETGVKEKWGRASLTVCVVSDEARHADAQVQAIARFAGLHRDAELVEYRVELL